MWRQAARKVMRELRERIRPTPYEMLSGYALINAPKECARPRARRGTDRFEPSHAIIVARAASRGALIKGL
jgi:hypothetical protein